MNNGKVLINVDEIISTINHSNEPTVLIEGLDDIIVYRKIEDIYDISVLQTGGRVNLLELFRRRNEFSGKKVAFIADKDYWCITGIPQEYVNELLIFTDGYSLENDIFIDINIIEMFSKTEKRAFHDELEKFSKWYSLALSRHISNQTEIISHHPNQIFQCDETYRSFCELKNSEKYPDEMLEAIQKNPYEKLRGKSLMDLAIRQLGKPKRNVVHKNPKAFLDIASANPGPLLKKIFTRVQETMN